MELEAYRQGESSSQSQNRPTLNMLIGSRKDHNRTKTLYKVVGTGRLKTISRVDFSKNSIWVLYTNQGI